MDFDVAKTKLDELVHNIPIEADKTLFLSWLRDAYLPAAVNSSAELEEVILARKSLQKIAGELKRLVPFEGILDSETILPPTIGEDSGLTSKNTVHVDSFIYGKEEEDRLVSEGLVPKSICSDCGSKNTEEITVISHSCSQEKIEYIFRGLLPDLKTLTVLDVGCRLGAVVFGAFYYSTAARILGVELNPDLCTVTEKLVKTHLLSKRIEILNEDIVNVPHIVKSVNVIVLNRVFDWFLSPEQQVVVWRFLKDTILPGTTLVTIPSLETSLSDLQTGISIEEWVEEVEAANPDYAADQDETSEIFLYKVK